MHPKRIIAIGFVLVLLGFVIPLLMVIKVIETSFDLIFISQAASVSGVFLVIIGAAMYSRLSRR